jgi:hypothetical protein
MRETLRVLVDRDVAVNPEMPGPLVQVLAAGVDIEVAAGVADRATGAPLEPGMLFPDLLLDRVIQAGEPQPVGTDEFGPYWNPDDLGHPSDVKLEATAT